MSQFSQQSLHKGERQFDSKSNIRFNGSKIIGQKSKLDETPLETSWLGYNHRLVTDSDLAKANIQLTIQFIKSCNPLFTLVKFTVNLSIFVLPSYTPLLSSWSVI